MNTNTPRRHSLDQPSGDGTRRAKSEVRKPHGESASPALRDAVRDQHDKLWVRYGTRYRSLWIAVSDFARPDIYGRLSDVDPRLIEPVAQRALRSKIAGSTTFRPALVAASPGWIDGHFVFGDGAVISPAANAHEVVVTFEPYSKFAPRGTLRGWQHAVGRVAADQSLALFTLSLAFVGPLLPFVPPDYLSPLFELVGGQGTGKTTLGLLAASVWAGNPDSRTGGGETWDLTPNRFDDLKLSHRQVLLLLDEGNLAGDTVEARRKLIHQAVFGLTNSGARQRMGDPPAKPHAQLAVLSTSNRPLSDLVEGSSAERGAMHERMITIPISKARPNGVLDHVPPGYAGAAQAIEDLRAAADAEWGTAGQAFVRQLQLNLARNEDRLRTILARGLTHHRERLSAVTDIPRVQKSLALTTVAGLLARRWGILPEMWGSPETAIRAVAAEALGDKTTARPDRTAEVRAYADRHRLLLIEVADLDVPLGRKEFEASAGFLRRCEGRTELLIPARRFQSEFPDHEPIMRALREAGQARTERGRKPKLNIKTPRAICEEGRVYCLRLDEPALALGL